MSLHTEIKDSLKVALKDKDATRVAVIRNIMSAITNELVASKRTPQETLEDEAVLTVIARLAKQRKESIEQYQQAGRDEQAKQEMDELVILESYLPEMLSQDEIKPIAEAKKVEMGIEDPAKMGMLVGAVMKELKGKADGGDVKAVVESLFE